ncbi:amino acid ABC transporter permease [Nocardioides dongkuii]|uniref:amino acid ABC transporter permease n=1 Tax=Nocardioides dongkuii TaxID=2760089 RepID=UPI0015FC1349|nr:amino acid ABC transporter permease [Nocardioides dongkuii]
MQDIWENYDLFLKAFGLTLGLLVVSGVLSLLLGIFLAALRVGPVSLLRRLAAVYVTVARNTPLVVVFIFFATVGPRLGYTFNSVEQLDIGGYHVSGYFFRSCLALTLYTSAFVCEALRSGINAVPLGQAEAARAIGLTFAGSMRQVILPQALRAAVPPLASVQIALAKNTSVAAAFGMLEATARMKFFINRNADDMVLVFVIFALGYVLIVEVISFGANRFERRFAAAR